MAVDSSKLPDLKLIGSTWDCYHGINQIFQRTSEGYWINKKAGKCLEVAGGQTGNGAAVQQWACVGLSHQKWIYNNGDKTIRPAHAPNMCLDVPGGSWDNGSKMQIWECIANNPNQQFDLSPYWGGETNIRALNRNNFCVDQPESFQTSVFTMWDCYRGVNQLFTRIGDGGLRVSKTGMCLDASDNRNGAPIHQWSCHGGSNQNWVYNPRDKSLRPVSNIWRCLDVSGGSQTNGAKLQLYDCNGTPAQQFEFFYT